MSEENYLLFENDYILQIDKLKEKVKILELELEQARYYGSDLNKFVNYNCKSGREGLVCINIDCALSEYKKDRFMIVESKHSREKISYAQLEILKKFASRDFQVYIVRGDWPYETISIYDLDQNLLSDLYGEDVIKWLQFDIDYNKKEI